MREEQAMSFMARAKAAGRAALWRRLLALCLAAMLLFLLCGCSGNGKGRTKILEPAASSGADFSVVGVSQPASEKEGAPLRYVGLYGQGMVAVWGRENAKRIVLVGKSGYLKPYSEELPILTDSVVCRGDHVLFQAKNGEERADIFLINLKDESVRKIGSYLLADLLVPLGWQDGDISFVVRGVSGAVLNRYHVQDHTLERLSDGGVLNERLPEDLKSAAVSRLFFAEGYLVCQMEIGAESQIVVVDARDPAHGSLLSTHGSSAAAAAGKVYYIAENGALMSWDVQADKKIELMEMVSQFAVSEDGSKLAVVEKSAAAYKLYVLDARSGQKLYVDIYQSINRVFFNADASGLLIESLQVDQAHPQGGYGGVYAYYELGGQTN